MHRAKGADALMADRALLLSRLDLAGRRGLEIGPLAWPFLSKTEHDILLADRLSTADLRAKFAIDPAVRVDEIAEIDVVIEEDQGLAEALAGKAPFDYAIASHVIEHVPDFVGFLNEIATLVPAPGGQLLLIVPDRRFTFDLLREVSLLREVIEACIRRSRRPSPSQVFDHFGYVSDVDMQAAWAGTLDPARVKRHGTPQAALDLSRRVYADQTYLDGHCWVFTPRSFLCLCERLAELGLLGWELGYFADTRPNELDFGLILQRSAAHEDPAGIARSFRAALNELGPTESELQIEALRAEADRLRGRLEALTGSRSWRITRPLRGIYGTLSRFRPRRI